MDAYSYSYPYVFYWREPPGFKGRRCRVTARGKMNSIRVEFEDGFRMITSRYAVRKVRHDDEQCCNPPSGASGPAVRSKNCC
jgi:hypothetical protein